MPAETTSATTSVDRVKSGEVSVGRIVLASLVGTTIEFYDFYIYEIGRAHV